MVNGVSGNSQVFSQTKSYVNNNVNNKKDNELPPSNETYRKNGKKVRKNIGLGWGTVIVAGTVAQCVWPFLGNIKSEKMHILKMEGDKELAKLSGKPLAYDVEKVINNCKKEITQAKKGAVLGAVLGLAASLGVVLWTNHHRDKKRAKLAAEPEKLDAKV